MSSCRGNSRGRAECARLRRVFENRVDVGASAFVPDLRPCRFLRRFTKPACDEAFHATGHPVVEGYDPPEAWGWCYIDEVVLDLGDRATAQNGPIPRYY